MERCGRRVLCAVQDKDLWETPFCGVFHRSGTIHRLFSVAATVQDAPGGTIGGRQDLSHPPEIAACRLTRHDFLVAPRRVTGRTRAILTVDIYGIPCDQAALRQLADEHDVWYIADAAQSLGATREGRPASSLADALVVSFTVGKALDVGEGGAILTDRTAIYERLLWLTQHPHRQKRELGLQVDNEIGLNARIHPLAAVWASATLEAALRGTEDRQRRAFLAINAINASGLAEPIPFADRGIVPSFFHLSAAWKDGATGRDGDLEELLRRAGIDARVGPAPVRLLYRQPAFEVLCRGARIDACPDAERQAERRFCVE